MLSSRYAYLLLAIFVVTPPARSAPIEAGVAITDSDTMQYLETHGFALSALLSPTWTRGAETKVLNNAEFGKIAPVAALRQVVRAEFAAYQKSYLARFPKVSEDNVGTGTRPDHRKFERNYLDSAASRFHLVGVINRMDRAHRSPGSCGEVRFLYRLFYSVNAAGIVVDGQEVLRQGKIKTESRLPVSINLVLRAKNLDDQPGDDAQQCQDLAKRWIAAGEGGAAGKELALELLKPTGALAAVEPTQIDRMETNIQVMRVPAGAAESFGGNAEYLLNIFNWNPGTHTFNRKRLENQIDREDLLRNPDKLQALKTWLFTPEHLHELAEGTITIPDEYLAYRAITSAPGGTARASNRPFLGLISDAEAEQAYNDLKVAAARLDPEGKLRNIESGFALQQRLTDITCTGCHQSRAIGGFHFMGADWKSYIRDFPQNAIFVAGSPHFYGDLPRRRAVVKAFADGKTPDFGRGFSMRPRKTSRGGVNVFPEDFDSIRMGWGANCYTRTNGEANADPSFKTWACTEPLICKPLHESTHEPGLGICVNKAESKAQLKIGDPFIFGELTYEEVPQKAEQTDGTYTYRDIYCAKSDVMNNRKAAPGKCLTPLPGSKPGDEQLHGYQMGGFFGGMKRQRDCADPLDKGTVCGTEAGATRGAGLRPIENAFNKCIVMLGDNKTSFKPCLTSKSFTHASTLRSCNIMRPCRDDYVCLATKSTTQTGSGACLPPYFLFQFRTDGHPSPPEGAAAPPECLLPATDAEPRPDVCANYPAE